MRVFWTIGKIVVALLACLAVVLILMRVAAPDVIDGNEADSAIMAVAVESLRTSARHVTYVSFDSRDPLPKQLAELREQTGLNLLPYSSRPKDTCKSEFVPPFCERDDFLTLSFVSMPLWRTALVNSNTLACHIEHTVVKGPNRWMGMSARGFCI